MREFDWPRISRACAAMQDGIRWLDGNDPTVLGPALRELLDALGAELQEPVPAAQDGRGADDGAESTIGAPRPENGAQTENSDA